MRVAALQALGYSLPEARSASRAAVADSAAGTSLEDRVKAALRTLVHDGVWGREADWLGEWGG